MAEDKEEDDGFGRFPKLPPPPDLPAVPKVSVKLPPHPVEESRAKSDAKGFQKTALASQAVGALVMPIIILTLGGTYLDKKMGTNWAAITGVLVGFVIGIISLLQILKRMSD